MVPQSCPSSKVRSATVIFDDALLTAIVVPFTSTLVKEGS